MGGTEHEEDEIRIQLGSRHAGHEPESESREHLKDRCRNRQASRERGERDDEHRDHDGQHDRLKVHC